MKLIGQLMIIIPMTLLVGVFIAGAVEVTLVCSSIASIVLWYAIQKSAIASLSSFALCCILLFARFCRWTVYRQPDESFPAFFETAQQLFSESVRNKC